MQVIFTLISAALLQAPADAALQPWASKAQPGDIASRHVEEISQAEQTYTVVHGGTIDGECCRTPMGCGINREGVIDQSWQSNRAVRMENVGQTDVINPWLSNGRNNFRTLDEIVASAITPGMSDKEKAMALWFQQVFRIASTAAATVRTSATRCWSSTSTDTTSRGLLTGARFHG